MRVDRPMRTLGSSRAASSSKTFERLRPNDAATSAGLRSRPVSERAGSRTGGNPIGAGSPQLPPVVFLVSGNGGPHPSRLCDGRYGSDHYWRHPLIRCQPAVTVDAARLRAGPMWGCKYALARLATALIGTAATAMPPQLRA